MDSENTTLDKALAMKPVVPAGYAYFCTILSFFAIIMLSVIAALFNYGAAALVDGLPEDVSGQDAASTCIATVIVYVVFFLFCGSQVFLSKRQGRIHL
ncbi:hypothetical protein BCR37DRAFT_375843 [Protomyces lactucae-debilis]|uniref:Uncharacterized protein n=1 Tax=Protomyces lactucae-debilis TaxID=2754530 RepID=A0A1Y2FV77_PROLT|nr:uncharacterized protein BCR37DRAFT_375843 [Protomyces lactucae-debilis]ORY87892.1 hypothetical protein BCR37DRAFT_375843 [Protomyces lactucae-debilis]